MHISISADNGKRRNVAYFLILKDAAKINSESCCFIFLVQHAAISEIIKCNFFLLCFHSIKVSAEKLSHVY
jgi:hypothetical protein